MALGAAHPPRLPGGRLEKPDNLQMLSYRHLLRHARLVLAVWLLALGVAIAAPALRPVALEMICAGGGMQLVERSTVAGTPALADDGAAPQARSLIDCPLCMPAGAPPAVLTGLPAPALPGHPAAVPPTPRLQVRSDAPAPARGPPSPLALT